MGKKRIVAGKDAKTEGAEKAPSAKASKRKIDVGVLHVRSTFNNTVVLLTDVDGNAVASSSSGALGFAGAKKGTPFAAAKVGETVAEKAKVLGVKEVSVIVKGVGSGRESAVRAFIAKGFGLSSIKDETPVPHNGPRPPRARRV